MKQFLLIVFCSFSFSMAINAQITLQSTNFTLSTAGKDSATVKVLKKANAVFPKQGNNQTWDYSALRDSIADEYYWGFITKPSKARPAAFVAANLEADHYSFFQIFNIPTRTYSLKSSIGYGTLGDSLLFSRFPLEFLTGNTADSLTFPASSRKLSTINYFYKFPMTDKTAWASTNKINTNFLLKVGAFGLDNVPGQQVQTVTNKDSVIGWGTLKLRSPAYGTVLNFNVLLQRKTTTTIDSFFLGGQPAPTPILDAFGLTQGERDTAISLYFVGIDFKAAHLAMEVDNQMTSITDMYRGILPNLGLVSKNKEITDVSVKSKVFPNPTTEGVSFEFDKKTGGDWNILIYNTVGQITGLHRVSAPQGAATLTVNLDKTLPNGTYFYNIVDENSLIRANGQFVKN
jgi:hypothetical protein